jgi:hypothetical protein
MTDQPIDPTIPERPIPDGDGALTERLSDVHPALAGDPAGEDRDVAFERVAIGLADGRELFVSVGAVGAARADRASVEMGLVGAVAAREARLSLTGVGAVAAQDARIEQSMVRTVVAGRVHLGRGALVGIVLAGRVDGEARPLLDWRGGLAVGAVVGLVWLLGRRLR